MNEQPRRLWLVVVATTFVFVCITYIKVEPQIESLSANVFSTTLECPTDMVPVNSRTFICVDKYEVSPGENCPYSLPGNEIETLLNIDSSGCQASSMSAQKPWTYISRENAAIACARAGKRLPTHKEWYEASLGTVDSEACNVFSGEVGLTGAFIDCVSAVGAYDMVGNVWEWVSADINEGDLDGLVLPPSGYVTLTDQYGVALETATTASAIYGEDYFWSNPVGYYGMIRGGYYAGGNDSGVYSIQSNTKSSALGAGIGFRCVL